MFELVDWYHQEKTIELTLFSTPELNKYLRPKEKECKQGHYFLIKYRRSGSKTEDVVEIDLNT